MDKLSQKELNILYEAFKKLFYKEFTAEEARKYGIDEDEILMTSRYGLNIRLVEEKIEGMQTGFYRASVSSNWNEFYPYLAQGVFMDRVEIALKQEFPDAYKIFNSLREKTKLKE
ncbi:hypothetical protein HYY70_00790 [Candidatus Woesearchaeota archaeon]|nr:hypothetical protein [Candidatus Woesearchaeota archaeon]